MGEQAQLGFTFSAGSGASETTTSKTVVLSEVYRWLLGQRPCSLLSNGDGRRR